MKAKCTLFLLLMPFQSKEILSSFGFFLHFSKEPIQNISSVVGEKFRRIVWTESSHSMF